MEKNIESSERKLLGLGPTIIGAIILVFGLYLTISNKMKIDRYDDIDYALLSIFPFFTLLVVIVIIANMN